MKIFKQSTLIALALLVAGGCATIPTGPSVAVLPAPGKSFDTFRAEDATCRQWAKQQVGASPEQTYNSNVATGAIAGTAIGTGLGAALGSTSGQAGEGALIGAAGGLLVGASAGSSAGQAAGMEAQRRFDNTYVQCMYSYGNQVPGLNPNVPAPSQSAAAAPPAAYLDQAPQFIYSPDLNLYVAVGIPYDVVYTGHAYFYFYGGRWYRGPYYNGPWIFVARKNYPQVLLSYRVDQIRHFRDREFRQYVHARAHYSGRTYRPENRRWMR